MHVAIAIVSMNSADQIADCLASLQGSTHADFRVFVRENGGAAALEKLRRVLSSLGLIPTDDAMVWQMAAGQWVTLLGPGENLGYAGGVNACLRAAAAIPYDAAWVLNPDTFPAENALAGLLERQRAGGFGMVGSRLVLHANGRVQCWGGLAWNGWLNRGRLLGFLEDAATIPDTAAVERQMNVVSGASMLVMRAFIEHVGLMDEAFFAYDEDVDWCLRRGDYTLGYAHASVVRHIHGASTGSSTVKARRSRLVVHLTSRNAVLLARKQGGWRLPVRLVLSFAQTFEELFRNRLLRHFLWAQRGFWAGLRGERGRPPWLA